MLSKKKKTPSKSAGKITEGVIKKIELHLNQIAN